MNVLRELAIKFLQLLLVAATEPVKEALSDGLEELKRRAERTPSPVDDAIVDFFIDVLS